MPETAQDRISAQCEPDQAAAMRRIAERLFPLHRAITGQGLRDTVAVLQEIAPFSVVEVSTGTEAFDWTVPKEWQIRDAYIADSGGKRIVDYNESNLHVINGSSAIDQKMKWTDLVPHIHTSNIPNAIPYKSNFFGGGWGFCVTQRQRDRLACDPTVEFEVVIDSSMVDGALTYGELFVPGCSDDELLVYAHMCHPSLANDNLSGLIVATFMARAVLRSNLHYSVRFVIAPATLGPICWLSRNPGRLARIKSGLVLALLGRPNPFHYKKSRRGDASVDRVMEALAVNHIHPYTPFGYDERQFGAPGINLPVGRLTRSLPGEFPEYHTSHDNLEFLDSEAMSESLAFCHSVLTHVDRNRVYTNTKPYGEPQLGKVDLYRNYGQENDRADLQEAVMWILNLSDGTKDVADISKASTLPLRVIDEAVCLLLQKGLLTPTTFSDEL